MSATAPQFAAFLVTSIADAATASTEIGHVHDVDAQEAARSLRSLQSFADLLGQSDGVTSAHAFEMFFALCDYCRRYLGDASAVRSAGCQAIALAGEEITHVALAPKVAPRKLSRVEVAEQLRDALADAEPGVEWKTYIKGDAVRLYATIRGSGSDRGYLWLDADGDVICDGWATNESARKREKIMDARIASLELLCEKLGVAVYAFVR